MKPTARAAWIAQTAAALWARKGYYGAGVEELSQAVGLQRGALYHHIGSKEALLHEISRQAIARLLAETALDLSRPAADQLRQLSRGLMADIAEHQAEWMVFFREIGWLTGERQAAVFALHGRYEQLWLDALAGTCQAG